MVKDVGATSFNGLMAVANIADAYKYARAKNEARYDWEPYVFHDAKGAFTVASQKEWWVLQKYTKRYLSGAARGSVEEITSEQFEKLSDEAEALWGTTDWTGTFVPGLLRPTLPPAPPESF